MADTITTGGTVILGGITYNIQEITVPQSPTNSVSDRLGFKSVTLHLQKPGAGPLPSDYKNPNFHNGGGKNNTT